MPECESKYIPLYYSYIEQLGLLTEEQVGRLVMALLLYGRDGTPPDFPRDSSLYMAFSFIADNSKRAADRIHDNKVRGGQARASGAQKDEKGRFLPSDSSRSPAEIQHNPAEPSTSSRPSYNNNKNKNKDKNNNNLPSRMRARDEDCMLKGVENSVAVSYYLDMVGKLTQAEADELMGYEQELGSEAMADVITIGYEYGAQRMEYIRRVVETKMMHPEHKPKLGDA